MATEREWDEEQPITRAVGAEAYFAANPSDPRVAGRLDDGRWLMSRA